MKKVLLATLLCALVVLCSACAVQSDIPRGYTQKEEHFDENGFQDYTDYCKYYYADTSVIENNKRFQKLTADQVQDIKAYFKDFAQWMETEGRSEENDFAPSCINAGDYVCKIKDSFEDYTILFFDIQSGVLYYIHHNN